MQLVSCNEHGIATENFYFKKWREYNLEQEKLAHFGIIGNDVLVDVSLIQPLQQASSMFLEKGFEMYVKDGYRSPEFIEYLFDRRAQKFGLAETERILNNTSMPHATGKAVDIALRDPVTKIEVYLRDGTDGVDAYFLDFYKDKEGEKARKFLELQELQVKIMRVCGFLLGLKREYWHFEYRKEDEKL